MPFYIIHHAIRLSSEQYAAIAQYVTQLHSEKFTAPRHFVNVKFEYHDPATEPPTFVGGKKRRTNYVIAHVRAGGSRTTADFSAVAASIADFWNATIAPAPIANGAAPHKPEERELHACFMLGDIVAGWEAGFTIPTAGEDVAWMKANWSKIEEKAKGVDPGPGGKEMWIEMMEEIRQRKLM